MRGRSCFVLSFGQVFYIILRAFFFIWTSVLKGSIFSPVSLQLILYIPHLKSTLVESHPQHAGHRNRFRPMASLRQPKLPRQTPYRAESRTHTHTQPTLRPHSLPEPAHS